MFWEFRTRSHPVSFPVSAPLDAPPRVVLWVCQLEKCKNVDFGRCPRVYCSGQPCLPMGQSDIPRTSTVKIYCPKCEDIYYPRSKYQGSILSQPPTWHRTRGGVGAMHVDT